MPRQPKRPPSRFQTKPNFPDEIPLEDSPFFQARLDHLIAYPALLRPLLEKGNLHLLEHLRDVAHRGDEELAKTMYLNKTPHHEALETLLPAIAGPEREELLGEDEPEWATETEMDEDLSRMVDQFLKWMETQPRTYQTGEPLPSPLDPPPSDPEPPATTGSAPMR